MAESPEKPKFNPVASQLARHNTGQVVTKEISTRLKANILREVIHDSKSTELVIAMAVSGENLRINRTTGAIEPIDDEPLDQGIRAKYLTLLTNKVLSAPKPVSDKTEDNHTKWIEALAKEKDAERDARESGESGDSEKEKE